MKAIPLRCRPNGDGIAPLIYTVVDDSDYELIRRLDLKVYPSSSFSDKNKTKKRIYAALSVGGGQTRLHQFLLKARLCQKIDHIDRDTLNNRRLNLRTCTQAENSRNRTKGPRSRSKYNGVTRTVTSAGTVRRQARFHSKEGIVSIGNYDTEVEAAKAYDAYVQVVFGRQQILNFADCTEAIVNMRRWSKITGLDEVIDCTAANVPIAVRVILNPGDSDSHTEAAEGGAKYV